MFCVGINTKVEQFQQVAREPQVSHLLLALCRMPEPAGNGIYTSFLYLARVLTSTSAAEHRTGSRVSVVG